MSILRWGMLRSSGDTQLPRADNRLTLLGESIADLLGEQCALSGLMGDQLCLGRVLLTSGLTLWGVEVTWLRSSAEPTLVPWWTEQLDRLDNSKLPLFLMSSVISLLFRMQIFMISN